MPLAGCQPVANLKHFYAPCSETSSSISFGVTRRYGGPLEDGDLFAVQPEERLEQREAVDQVMQHVRGKKDLEDLITAISESNGGPCPNQELATDLGITVSQVVSRKKRIRRSCERDSPQPPKPRKEPQVL